MPTPINPARTGLQAAGYASPVFEENPNIALVNQGMNVAEDEAREAAATAYPGSDSPDDFMEDTVDDDEGITEAPEVAAIHEEWIPSETA